MLSTEEVYSIIDKVAPYKPSVYLSAAEVFRRRDIMEILEYVSGKNLKTSFTTNGMLIKDKHVDVLAGMSNLRINFSIDGLKETLDENRGKGNFEKTIGVIGKLIQARGDNKYPFLNTNTTFSPDIVGNMQELIDYLVSIKVDSISFQHLWFTDPSKAALHKQSLENEFGINDSGAESHIIRSFSPEYLEKLSIEVERIQNKRHGVTVVVNPRMNRSQIMRYYTDLNFSRSGKCQYPWDRVLIKANGDVMFCPDEWVTEFNLGSIRNSKLAEMWNGEQARKFRKSLIENGLFPVCGRCCAINVR